MLFNFQWHAISVWLEITSGFFICSIHLLFTLFFLFCCVFMNSLDLVVQYYLRKSDGNVISLPELSSGVQLCRRLIHCVLHFWDWWYRIAPCIRKLWELILTAHEWKGNSADDLLIIPLLTISHHPYLQCMLVPHCMKGVVISGL